MESARVNIDVKKELKELYSPGKKEFAQVTVPVMRYLAIDGQGDPNTSAGYQAAVESLYTLGYSTRAEWKEQTGNTFVVGPLEALWWSEDPATFLAARKNEWKWTMLIALPDPVDSEFFDLGVAQAHKKKPELPIREVRLQTIEEGESLQILHIGSYEDEGPVLARLHQQIMVERELTFNGPHHEIYLSDPRKTAPEKLKTVLRQPVRPR